MNLADPDVSLLGHGGFLIPRRLLGLGHVLILGGKVGLGHVDGGRLGVGGHGSRQPHHNEDDLHMTPGRHHTHHQEQHEDLRGGERVVKHIRDEAENQQNLDAHEDNQPRKDQHPLAIRECCLCQAAK